MADEQNNPTPVPTPFDPQTAPESVKETQDKTIRELRDVPVETVPDAKLAPEDQAIKQAELPDARDARRAGEDALNKPIEAIEDSVNAADKADQAHAVFHPMPHIPSGSTTLLGYTIPLPIYTVVYGILFVITILEVLVSSLPRGILGTAVLIGLSACKAVLVVLFYMHLKDDSRLFAFALILPLFIALVSSIFLLTVPIKGY